MIVLKIIGIVFLAILVLLAVLLLCPIKVRVHFKSGCPTEYKVRYLFVAFSGGKKAKKPKKQNKKEAEKPKKKDTEKKSRKKPDLETIIKTVFFAIKKIPFILHHIRIEKLSLRCVCASSDAAQTALHYGVMCALFYPLAAFVKEETRMQKMPEVELSADFDAKTDDYDIFVKLHTLLLFAFIVLVRVFFDYLRNGGTINERN